MTIRELYRKEIIRYKDKVTAYYLSRCRYEGPYSSVPSELRDIPLKGFTVTYQTPWGMECCVWLIRDCLGGEADSD